MNRKDGLLVVDKPAGMSSFDVVRRVRRLAGTRKVGHTGTLDPDATGVLAVALGRCTKLANFLVLDEKRYGFTIRFGVATDTDDASGEVIREASLDGVTREALEEALKGFQGEIDQVPPIYSALKIEGKRAYARARAGEVVEMKARKVRVDELVVKEFALPEAVLEVRCGPGTYVRSLARDLGEVLGSAAHTRAIRRLGVGPFSLSDAVNLEELGEEDFWERVLSPLEMVQSLDRVAVDEAGIERLVQGQPLFMEGEFQLGQYLAAHHEGELIAIVEYCVKKEAAPALWPRRVMR